MCDSNDVSRTILVEALAKILERDGVPALCAVFSDALAIASLRGRRDPCAPTIVSDEGPHSALQKANDAAYEKLAFFRQVCGLADVS